MMYRISAESLLMQHTGVLFSFLAFTPYLLCRCVLIAVHQILLCVSVKLTFVMRKSFKIPSIAFKTVKQAQSLLKLSMPSMAVASRSTAVANTNSVGPMP